MKILTEKKKILCYLDIIKEVLYVRFISQVHLLMSVTFRQQSYSILTISKDLIKLGGHMTYKINLLKYQKRGKGFIDTFLTWWLKTFNWIHFPKEIIVSSNFCSCILHHMKTSRKIFATFTFHAVYIHNTIKIICMHFIIV